MSHRRYHLQLNESEFGIHTVNFCTCLLFIGYGTHGIWDEGGDISPEENGGTIASFLEKNSLGLGKGGLYPLPCWWHFGMWLWLRRTRRNKWLWKMRWHCLLVVGKVPWRRKWQPTPVFLPGKFHGRRRLVGYIPLGHKKSDPTEQLTHTC